MNVIIIYTDDQGYGDVSLLNPNAKFQTPNIDKIAKEGLSFTDAHCSSAVCSPSRYGLLTGRYNWRTTLKAGVMKADDPCLIAPERETLATLFQRHGYSTMMIGKWHLGMTFDGEFGNRDWDKDVLEGPADHGFDYFYGIPASMNFGILSYIENRHILEPAVLYTGKKLDEKEIENFHYQPPYCKTMELDHCTVTPQVIEIAPSFKDEDTLQILTDKTLQKIRGTVMDEKPFFLYLALNSPHKPVAPSKAFWGTSEAGRYGDFMVETDYQVGRILDCLDELNLEQDTMVIFTSDNGPEQEYMPRKEKHGHDSAGGLRGGKRDLYDGGHRVPFFVKYPNMIDAGRVCDEPICQTDLYATFAEMLGETMQDNQAEDSVSIVPAMQSADYEKGFRGAVVHHSGAGYFAIREGKWKLNMIRGDGGAMKVKTTIEGEPLYELYDMYADGAEQHNLILEYPEIANQLKEKITQYVLNGRSTPGAPQKNDGDAWWRQLTWMEPDVK